MDPTQQTQFPGVVTTALVVISAVFPVISALSIILRIVARRKSGQALQSDDYWIIASWFLTLGLSCLVWYYAGQAGIDYYNVDMLTGTEASLELVFISSCYVQFPLAAVKIAVLLFYKRIFSTPMFKTVVWCSIAVVSVWAVVFFLLVLLEIDPISFPLTQVTLKYDSSALGLAQVATSFVLDLIVLSLPLPLIFRLKMAPERRVAVALIFWMGAFCVVAAIVRTVLLDQSIRSVVSSVSYEHVSSQAKQYIWMVLEPNCSILAACLPTYGPLISGGRAPESIVRSVRSIFSLRSLRGSGSGSGGSRPSRRNYVQNPTPQFQKDGSVAESQVELNSMQKIPGYGQQEVTVSGQQPPLSVFPPQGAENNRIYVTNGVTVDRD